MSEIRLARCHSSGHHKEIAFIFGLVGSPELPLLFWPSTTFKSTGTTWLCQVEQPKGRLIQHQEAAHHSGRLVSVLEVKGKFSAVLQLNQQLGVNF